MQANQMSIDFTSEGPTLKFIRTPLHTMGPVQNHINFVGTSPFERHFSEFLCPFIFKQWYLIITVELEMQTDRIQNDNGITVDPNLISIA